VDGPGEIDRPELSLTTRYRPSTDTRPCIFRKGGDGLESFTFWLDDDGDEPTRFYAYVMQWTGAGVTGPVLFASGPLSTGLGTEFEEMNVNTDGLCLIRGTHYVAFLDSSAFDNGTPDSSSMAFFPFSDPYPYGAFTLA